MLKRKQMIVAAAALAAAPLAAKAAVTVTYGYDVTVSYATNTAFTTGTGTASISGGAVTIPAAGDYFRFNVNARVVGDTNPTSGGAYDQSTGNTQPPNLGLQSFGFTIADSSVATVVPVVTSGKSTLKSPNSANGAWDINSKGTSSATTGQVGTLVDPLTAGFNTALTTSPAGYYRLTLGASAAQDLFTGLTYQAVAGGTAVLTPSLVAGDNAVVSVTDNGAGTPPSYGSNSLVTINPFAALTINVTGGPPPTNAIVSLTTAAPSTYGSLQGTVTATGTGTSYVAGTKAISPPTGKGYVNGVLSGTPSGSTEIYALDITNSTGGAPTDLTAIDSAIAAITGVTAVSGTNPGPFPAGYNVFITFNPAPTPGGNFLGFDLTGTGSDTDLVASVALVPEPASAAFILVGASSLLLGRRRRTASQVA